MYIISINMIKLWSFNAMVYVYMRNYSTNSINTNKTIINTNKTIINTNNYININKYQVIAAKLITGVDVTIETRLFYRFDNIRSCASLQRWLVGFNHEKVVSIKILFMDPYGMVNISNVDLDNDRELISNVEIPDGDVSLLKLPARWVDIY